MFKISHFKKTAFMFLVLSVASCAKYDDYVFEVVNMKATNADNSGELPIDALTDSVAGKAYAIKLEYTMESRGGTGDNLDTHESGYVNEDRLTSMNIYSLNPFDSTHAAGSSLNDYFIVSYGGTINSQVETGVIGAGNNQGSAATSWNGFEYLFLMRPPQTIGSFSFVVDIGLSDGRHLVDTTSVILF